MYYIFSVITPVFTTNKGLGEYTPIIILKRTIYSLTHTWRGNSWILHHVEDRGRRWWWDSSRNSLIVLEVAWALIRCITIVFLLSCWGEVFLRTQAAPWVTADNTGEAPQQLLYQVEGQESTSRAVKPKHCMWSHWGATQLMVHQGWVALHQRWAAPHWRWTASEQLCIREE